MNNIEDNSTERTAELTPAESETLLLGHIWQQPENDSLVCGAISSVIGARENQQDSCYMDIEPDGNAIGIVCDGMGGLQGGEVASQQAVCMFVEDFEQVRRTENNFYHFFCNEMIEIDDMVAGLTDDRGELLSAGTTLVGVAIKNGFLQWISVGDSKIYIIRGDDMACVTQEHNYLMLLNKRLKEGTIDEEEYAKEVKRGAALISYLGMGNVNLMDANPNPLPLEDGDVVVLCSDGLYKALSDAQIYEIISKNTDNLELAVQELQMQAQMAAGRVQDNTSIVMLSYRPNI